ncbi:DUF448 domain-containing protein [Qipengyuania gaetbuli]|uniref:DUF448 domain-containing protein n=1 Tax=Qipengyuania gaetbuli TaxID=266952 RepID=UPI001C992070|nr:DUF448 domain-containing protein [Qipengyuania gaetbuli]MBY6014280.1 DUF448 domain-containing protein [Qipengyuania gaetbuli]
MRTPPNERLSPDIAEDLRPRKPEPAKSRPERRCILTGESGPRASLVRLAVSPSGLALPDAHEKAPGRGAWVRASRTMVEEALANGKLKGALSRAFKTGELEIPQDLPAKIEDALRRVFLDRLGLEMRVGSLILGTQRIAETARGGGVALLLHASDASEDGRKKLDQAWRVGEEAEGSGMRGWELPLDRDALSVALGRDNVVHMALADDAAVARVLRPLERLMHYLGQDIPADNGRAVARAADDTNDKTKRNEQE